MADGAGLACALRGRKKDARRSTDPNTRLTALAFRTYLLPSCLIMLATSAGLMVDNAIAGNILGPSAVAAIGLSSPFIMLLSGSAGIVESGAVALAVRALGERDRGRVNLLLTCGLVCAFVLGSLIAALGVTLAPQIAAVLGAADAELAADVADYVRGLAMGAFPVMATMLLMGFCRVDGDPNRGTAAIATMVVADAVFNLIALLVFNAGMLGMGIATLGAYTASALVCATHFWGKRNTLALVRRLRGSGALSTIRSLLTVGMPDSLGRVTVLVRTTVYNNLLMVAAGSAAVTAYSVHSSIYLLSCALILGICRTSMLLFGLFWGEGDRRSLMGAMHVALRYGLVLCVAMAAVLFAGAPAAVGMFGLQEGTQAFDLAVRCVRIFQFCCPFMLFNELLTYFFQTTGDIKRANIIVFVANLCLPLSFLACTFGGIGVDAVWFAPVFAEATESLLLSACGLLTWRLRHRGQGKQPARQVPEAGFLQKAMVLRDDFGERGTTRAFSCGASIEQAVRVSREVLDFCEQQGVCAATATTISLAVEEMAGNTVEHGFAKTHHPSIDILVAVRPDEVLLRVRDNGVRFNPLEHLAVLDARPVGPAASVPQAMGLHMIARLATSVDYQNTLGINNLIVTVAL